MFDWENNIALFSTNQITNMTNMFRQKLQQPDLYKPELWQECVKNIGIPQNVCFMYPSYGDNADKIYVGTDTQDMSYAFCHRTLGVQPVTGKNVRNMAYTYDSATNCYGTINFMQEFQGDSSSVNGYMMFANRNMTQPLYINVVENSAWANWMKTNCTIYGDTPLTWIVFDEDYLVNMETNTYLLGKITGCVWLNHFVVNAQTTTFNVKYGL